MSGVESSSLHRQLLSAAGDLRSHQPLLGFSVPRDVPDEVIEKYVEAFVYAVSQERFREAIDSRGIIFAPMMGTAADQIVAKCPQPEAGPSMSWASPKTARPIGTFLRLPSGSGSP